MASCESDNFRSNLSFENHFVKEPESVSCRLFGSSERDPSSAPKRRIPMSRSGVRKNTHHPQKPAQMPTFGSTQISYGSLKKLTDAGGSMSESHSPSLRSPRYYSPSLTEVSASNREGLGGFQSPGYEHLTTYTDPDHPFQSTSTSSSGSRDFHPGIRVESDSPLSHHFQQDRRHGDTEVYSQPTAVKLQLEQPAKIECSHVMSPSSWVYPNTHQMNTVSHQMNYHEQDTPSGLTSTQSQLPQQSPGLSTSAVHLALKDQNGTSPDNPSRRSHSPSTYTFQGPTTSALHGDHSDLYNGGGISAPSTPSFSDTDLRPTRTSESCRLLNEGSYTGSRGPLGPRSSIHIDYANVYVERAQDLQLLLCSQCPQRFATHEQFVKHQIKHQKLHRCRISGCSRVEGFTTPNDRDRHEKSVHKTPGMYFRCMDESCASYMKTFARRDNLKDHLKRMHKMPQNMDDMEANEKRNELADSWRVDLTPELTTPPGM